MSFNPIGTFFLFNGTPNKTGFNISLEYGNSSKINFHVSSRNEKNEVISSTAQPIKSGEGISLEMKLVGGLLHFESKVVTTVPEGYKFDTLSVGGGSNLDFDGKIGLNVKAVVPAGEMSFVGINDGRNAGITQAKGIIAPLLVGDIIFLFFTQGNLIVHRKGALPNTATYSYSAINIPYWGMDFSVQH
ncbi:MAG: hypothetical protein KBF73_01060 [Flavobacteriales bacterium]|nr:hypothetical protein [Flavobacteriales bacterium]